MTDSDREARFLFLDAWARDAADLRELHRLRVATLGSAERTIHPCYALSNASTLARSVALVTVLRREVLPPRRPWWLRLWAWAARSGR